jgi:hypothetical protein
MIIFEWHMRKIGRIKAHGKQVPLLRLKVKKREAKTYPAAV